MSTFKHVPQRFLFTKMVGFWLNMVKNYQGDVHDDDFFKIVRNCFEHDKAIELIEAAYSESEIEEMKRSRARSNRLDLADGLDDVFQAIWNHEDSRDRCRIVLESIGEYMVAECGKSRKSETIEGRFDEIVRVLKLDEVERDVLMLAYVKTETCFEWPCRVEDREKPLYYAMALDRSYSEVLKVMNATGRLRKFSLLDNDWDFNGRVIGGYMDGVNAEAIERRFYRKIDLSDVLPWEYYGDLSRHDGGILKRMLRRSGKKCNILFYGAPGTGKSSFAKSLAKELGLTAFEIKQGDDDGKNMKSEARMMGIQICNEQENAIKSIMVVDEADELLRSSSCGFSFFGFDMGGKSTEKGVMNSILDEMRVPAIWISNAPANTMDESVRRRFDYSVCFEELNNTQRVSIWRNVVGKLHLEKVITEERIQEYACKYATSAGGIATVLENVRRMRPAQRNVDSLVADLMKPHCKLLGVRESSKFLPAKGYSLDGLNIKGKIGLSKIVMAIRHFYDDSFNSSSEDKPRMNLLMFGPPGTGKSEFVKYLGKELDRNVLVMKGSDLISKYVGETEQKIAAAFRRAEDEHAILFFDEIDGLVQSRESARASWEVTQVNELLQQMENFDGVMVAATNFCKNLDPAIMRRFTFKLEFDYLDDAGKRIFFERIFKTSISEGEMRSLNEIQNLTPGDFRTVRQEHFYLGEAQSNEERIAALRAECEMKHDGKSSRPIGFGV